ncbi:MAG TPA: NADH-quinone oxidoreductase subunit N [Chitinophagaceae bacterium]|nr:NADH-quinone oxidoreductase subunit N [Chitinophagaceae bacterium]
MTAFFLLMKQELLVTLLLFILLFIKLSGRPWPAGRLAGLVHILLAINLAAGFCWIRPGHLFGDMYQTSELLAFEKNLLSLATLLISLFSVSWLKHHRHALEFYLLLLSTLLGMFLLLSSGNLLMFYLGLELAGIPLAALANFDLDRRRSSEAAMKYIFSSAFASGLLLFGISLLYGSTGTLSLAELPGHLAATPLELFAFILVFSGLGFKISAVPFHLWTADVYEGAPVVVTAYFSVVSKGSVVFFLLRVLYESFMPLQSHWYLLLSLVAVLTLLTGNLFAIRQQNLKRLLAFSSITQVGFILVGMSGQSPEGQASVLYFVLIYVFSNLAAFGVISLVSAATGRETLEDYRGFYRTNPALGWVLAIALFSLAGIPPTAGFFGKFFLLLAGVGKGHYLVIAIAALNMVISLYYYLRVVRAVFMESSLEPIGRVPVPWPARLSLALCTGGILVTGLASGAYQYLYSLVR